MKQLEVTILGHSYVLACPEGAETALLQAVNRVDREMSAIRDAGKVKARERIAVLAALNLAYSLADRSEENATPMTTDAGAADIDVLVRRLDQTLGADGQLL